MGAIKLNEHHLSQWYGKNPFFSTLQLIFRKIYSQKKRVQFITPRQHWRKSTVTVEKFLRSYPGIYSKQAEWNYAEEAVEDEAAKGEQVKDAKWYNSWQQRKRGRSILLISNFISSLHKETIEF